MSPPPQLSSPSSLSNVPPPFPILAPETDQHTDSKRLPRETFPLPSLPTGNSGAGSGQGSDVTAWGATGVVGRATGAGLVVSKETLAVWRLHEGRMCLVLGPSGVGKTLIMKRLHNILYCANSALYWTDIPRTEGGGGGLRVVSQLLSIYFIYYT